MVSASMHDASAILVGQVRAVLRGKPARIVAATMVFVDMANAFVMLDMVAQIAPKLWIAPVLAMHAVSASMASVFVSQVSMVRTVECRCPVPICAPIMGSARIPSAIAIPVGKVTTVQQREPASMIALDMGSASGENASAILDTQERTASRQCPAPTCALATASALQGSVSASQALADLIVPLWSLQCHAPTIAPAMRTAFVGLGDVCATLGMRVQIAPQLSHVPMIATSVVCAKTAFAFASQDLVVWIVVRVDKLALVVVCHQ